MTEGAYTSLPQWRERVRPAMMAAAVGIVLCITGAIFWPGQFFRSYLIACLYWLGISLGCLAILMLQHATRGRWGLVLRHILEAAARTLPVSALLFVPVLLGMGFLYPWLDPAQLQLPEHPSHEQQHVHDLLVNKQPYLSLTFFLVRAVIYFAIWIGLAFVLTRLSERNEREPSPALRQRLRTISGPGMALYGLTVSLAAVDWIMSMEPLWWSTIFGVILAMSQILSGMGFAVAILIWLRTQPEVAEAMNDETWGDLGNLLLAFVMLWAYMGFSQFFLIWNGNLPNETIWYSHRAQGFWEVVAWSLIILYFCVPFALLLSRDIKHDPRRLIWVPGIVLIMAYVHYFWLVMPAPYNVLEGETTHMGRPFQPEFLWLDAGAFVAVGGLWFGWFLWCLQARALMPVRELERVEEAQHV